MPTYRSLGLIVLGLGIFLLTPAPAWAQQDADGSIYSRFGLGELFDFSSAQIQGVGGGGAALTSLNYVNLSNPATWADQSLTRVAGSLQFQGLEIEDNQGLSSRLNSSMLKAFQFSFPIRAGSWGAVLSFTPYSRVAHKVEDTPEPLVSPLQDSSTYQITFEGEGGLQKATAGFGFRPSRNISFGVTADFIFGIIRESRDTRIFPNESGSGIVFTSTDFNKSTRLVGVTSTLGGLVTFPDILSDNDALSVGVSVSLPTTLSGTRTRTIGPSSNALEIGEELKGDVELPMRSNVGLTYYLSRWAFVTNLMIEPWSAFDSELDLPGFVPGGSSSFRDRTRFSLGVDFQPSSNALDSYFNRMGYRIGFYTESWYVDIQDIDAPTTTALTGGISLPTLFPGTRIDINLEAGRRRSNDARLVDESFYKIHINVNIGERWFEKRKLG